MLLGVLALIYAGLWVRDRERGMLWLAVGLALVASWYFNSERIGFPGPAMDTEPLRVWGVVLGVAILSINIGVVRYLGPPTGWSRGVVYVFFVPIAVLMIGLVLGPDVPRRAYHIGGLAPYVGTAILALIRHRDEPDAGHLVLAVVLLLLPAIPLLMLAAGVDPRLLRHFAAVPVIVFAMLLLTVSLLRRRKALEAEVARRIEAERALLEVNSQLEQRVEQRTADLREIVAGLESFNRAISHDLRGPLGGIAELARRANEKLQAGDSELALRALPAISRQAETSTRLVSTLLNLARLSDRRTNPQPVVLPDLVNLAYDEVKLARAGRETPPLHRGAMPRRVRIDPDLVRPVLVNLIGNAAKFSCGSATPRIEVDGHWEHNDLVVSVRDNGIGFDPSDAESIFKPFKRLEAERFEGHGLGLSIVRRAIESCNGSVWATARHGEGATFSFRIPDAQLDESQSVGAGSMRAEAIAG